MKKREKVIFIILNIIAVICVAYGIKVLRTGYGTAFFIVWLVLGAGFSVLSFVYKNRLWTRLPKVLRRTIMVIVSIALVFFVSVEAMIASQLKAKGDKGLDYIIVLGALVNEDGPSSITAARLNSAIQYLEDNPDTKCIVSGGQGFNEPWSEAEGMRRYLEEKGIDADRIIMEDQSTNTIQNISYSMKLMDKDNPRVGIVTSNFHVYRAVKIAKKQGLKEVCGIAGYVVPVYLPSNMFREFFGVVKDTIKGNM